MTGIDALIPGKTRVAGEAQAGTGGHKADQDSAAAFHSVMRDVTGRGEERPVGGKPTGTAGDEAETVEETEKKPSDKAEKPQDTDAAAVTQAATPSGDDAARLLAALTGGQQAPTVQDEAAGDGSQGGKSRTAGAAAAPDLPNDTPVSLKATVVARETHFEPVRRPESLDRMRVEPQAADGPAADEPVAVDARNSKGVRPADHPLRSALADASAAAATQPAGQAAAAAATPRPAHEARANAQPTAPSAAAAGTVAHATDTAEIADTGRVADTAAVTRPVAATSEKDVRGDGDARGDVRETAAAGAEATETVSPGIEDGSPDALPTQTLQRLAGSIVSEARAMASAAAAAASADGAPQQASGGPVKILTLRLQPEHLGTVTVRMRLVGNALEMQFRVSNAETAELLKRDRDSLADILKSSGYDADLLTIQASGDGLRAVVSTDASSGGATAGARQDLNQQQDAFRQGAGNPDGRQDNGGRDGRDENAGRRGTERRDETVADGGRAGDLYV